MGEIRIKNADTHDTPSTGYSKIYPKVDKKWYGKDDAGTEVEFATSLGLDQDKVFFVSKAGDDTNDGLSIEKPFLTFAKAITDVTAETPTVNNPWAISCIDAGIYIENFTIPAYVNIQAPSASIYGNIVINDFSSLNLNVLAATTGIALTKTTGAGAGSINCNVLTLVGTSSGILCTSGGVCCAVGTAINNGTGNVVGGASTGDIDYYGNIMVMNSSGYGVDLSGTGSTSITVNSMNGALGTGIRLTGAAEAQCNIVHLNTGVAYDVAASAHLDLVSAQITGTETNLGIAHTITSTKGAWLDQDVTTEGTPTFQSVTLDPTATPPSHTEGLLYYDSTNKCITSFNSESEVAMQHGQELWVYGYNDSGSTITNGQVCYLSGTYSGFPTFVLAKADDEATCLSTLGFATHPIENGTFGFVTITGMVHDVNTDGCAGGTLLYLSDSVAGSFTSTAPTSPNYRITLGNCNKSHISEGSIFCRPSIGDNTSSTINLYNGASLQTIDVNVSSNGTLVTTSIEKSGGGDINFFFNGNFVDYDSTPAATVTLTAGTDAVPVLNYVYVLASNNTLTANTTGFPSAQHAPIATFVVQSAASAQTDGIYKAHVWTDHIASSNSQGHLAHLNSWIRQQNATWISGALPSYSPDVGAGSAATVHVSSTAGQILQLHSHTFPAINTLTGDVVYVVNDSTTPYNKLSGFVRASLLNDSTGSSMSGDFWNGVLWGVVSEDADDCHFFLNLPSGSYAKSQDALSDSGRYNNFSIPSAYKGCGFLISLITFEDTGSQLGVENIIDLRGSTPVSAGGGVSTAQTEFSDSDFRVNDATDPTKQLALECSGITTGTTRTLTIPDKDGTIATIADLPAGVSADDVQAIVMSLNA